MMKGNILDLCSLKAGLMGSQSLKYLLMEGLQLILCHM